MKDILLNTENMEHLFTIKNVPVYCGPTDSNANDDILSDMPFYISKDSGIIQIPEVVDIKQIYQKNHNDAIGKTWDSHNKEFSEFITKFNTNNFLEVGSGTGKIFKIINESKKNIRWTMMEPNPLISEKDYTNLKIIKDFFDKKYVNVNYDCIVHSHFLEHLYTPMCFIKECKELAKGSLHIFSIPNMRKWLSKKNPTTLFFEHPNYLEEDYVIWMYENSGFKLIEKKYYKDHSIFFCFERVDESACKKIENKYKENKQNIMEYFDYYSNIVSEKNKICSKEKFICGPAHILTTTMFSFGLNVENLDFFVDGSKLKQNKRMYGFKKYIFDYNTLIESKNPVLINGGEYESEIKNTILNINDKVKFI